MRMVLLGIFFLLIAPFSYSQQKPINSENLQDDKTITLQQQIDIGSELQKKENYRRSISYFIAAIEIAKEMQHDSLLFRSYIKLGKSYLYSWKNEKAIEAYYNALTIAKKNKDVDQELIAYSGLIAFLPFINKEDKAVDFSVYALSLVDKASFKNKENHVKVLTTICDAFMAQGDYDSMLPHLEKGIALAEKLNYQAGLLDLYIKKGKFFRHKKKWEQAFLYLHKAETILKENHVANSFFPKVNTNYSLALCYYDLEKYDNAIEYLLNSIALLKDEDLEKDNVIDTYSLLAKCYSKKGNYKESNIALNTVIKLKDSSRLTKDKAINAFHEQDSETFLLQIVALQNQGKEDKQRMSYMLWGIIIASFAFFLILFLYIKKQKANKATFKALIQKKSILEENEKTTAFKKSKNEIKYIAIDDTTVKEIIERLKKLEDQEYFLNSNCSLSSIAKKVKTNVTYLSQIINNYKGKTFNDYINDLRIEYVLNRLKNDKKFRSFSVKAIATELGYKSDDSFVKHFKNKTGLNPSYYIKELNKMEVL
ncbi:tetratricopeptide repeat protein [Kordia sp. YSTF-M3]|uniref:Tetratricopeptide repeat protein n=1 Tax=Kordia aestuariivivens TaxID=2759037 RepID=A0ABR7QAP3_9FLAO|nr:tetratricopeptide repeat protein [Kordia aestuariivivens]MBC8755602.1 tetratricopeptide repeat protein [Kordia aestuariivivens]